MTFEVQLSQVAPPRFSMQSHQHRGHELWTAPPQDLRTYVPKISNAQQAQIVKLALEVGVGIERVRTYFGVALLKDIPAADFQRVIRSLEHRRAA